MLVVIPTYKRNYCLHWVLQSIVQCHVDAVPEKIRVLIVNNYPPAAKEIRGIVSQFHKYSRFEWDILYRKISLAPVDNWYSAITEMALPDEVVYLHGDDDIFLPWALQDRFLAIKRCDADMLLSRWQSRIVFDEESNNVLIEYERSIIEKRPINRDPKEVTLGDVDHWGSAFISGHVYRFTEHWRNALALCFKWANSQEWLDNNTNTLMIPYYLPIAIKLLGGKLFGLDTVCVLRGAERQELNRAPFGVPGWNSGFLAMAAYQILCNSELGMEPLLNASRAANRKMAIQWLPTLFFDKNINKVARKKMLSMAKLTITVGDLTGILRGLRIIIGEVSGLRTHRLNRKFGTSDTVSASEFLRDLEVL